MATVVHLRCMISIENNYQPYLNFVNLWCSAQVTCQFGQITHYHVVLFMMCPHLTFYFKVLEINGQLVKEAYV